MIYNIYINEVTNINNISSDDLEILYNMERKYYNNVSGILYSFIKRGNLIKYNFLDEYDLFIVRNYNNILIGYFVLLITECKNKFYEECSEECNISKKTYNKILSSYNDYMYLSIIDIVIDDKFRIYTKSVLDYILFKYPRCIVSGRTYIKTSYKTLLKYEKSKVLSVLKIIDNNTFKYFIAKVNHKEEINK